MGAPAASPRLRPSARPKPKPRPKSRPAPRSRAAAPARKPRSTAGRSRVAAGGSVAMLPVNAVGGIADSGFVVGMTRGRAWIMVIGLLLGGIVALNVVGLSLSASGSSVSTKVDELQQENSVMRARIANRLSNERITEAASTLGLAVPAPDAVHYIDAKSSDAETAAKRLADGLIANAPPGVEAAVTDPVTTTDPATVPTDPTAVAVDPATTATTAPVDPTATTTIPAAPTTSTTTP
jgi:hypothetical protein